MLCVYCVTYTLLLFSPLFSFNIDTQSTYLLKNENGLFGYSVALHRSSSENVVLVGSPNGESNINGLSETGVIYKCDVSDDSTKPVQCNNMVNIFNDGTNKYYNQYGERDIQDGFYNILAENKTGQFLGVSLVSSDEYIAACAHRYEHRFRAYQLSYRDDPPRQLVGRCLIVSTYIWDIQCSN